MMTVSVQAFRYDMKYLTRYAIIVIAMINIIKLLKYEIDPVINNTKATNKKKVFTLPSSLKNSLLCLIFKTILQIY